MRVLSKNFSGQAESVTEQELADFYHAAALLRDPRAEARQVPLVAAAAIALELRDGTATRPDVIQRISHGKYYKIHKALMHLWDNHLVSPTRVPATQETVYTVEAPLLWAVSDEMHDWALETEREGFEALRHSLGSLGIFQSIQPPSEISGSS